MARNKNTFVKKQCAIYTRKSSEEGLEQEFNSLHAQRDAAEAYVHSQKHEDWVLISNDYDVHKRKLIINPEEAEVVKLIFRTFVKTRSIIATCKVVNEKGHKTKQIPLRDGSTRGGIDFAKNTIHRILKNRIYIGEIGNKGGWYPGEHPSIITMDLWAKARGTFDVHASLHSRESRNRQNPSFLRGLLYGPDGHVLATSSTRRQGQQFRYYVSRTAQAKGYKNAPPAATVGHSGGKPDIERNPQTTDQP